MNISIGARTDVGGRSNNEDCLAVLDKERAPLRADAVLIVADGMGGRANGEQASGIAVKLVRETVMEILDPNNDQSMPPAEDILAAGMRRANSKVYELSQENPDAPGMGTTCIAALVSEGILTFAHVGDSRGYLIRDDVIKPLTHDHTYVAEQVRAGNLTAEAARKSRFRNVITRAIGIAPTVQPDFNTFPLLDRDTVLFCTDGLSNTLDEEEMLEIVNKCDSAQGSANSLLEAAKAAGVRDNVTIITIRVSTDVLSGRMKRSPSANGQNGSKPTDDPTAKDEELKAVKKPEDSPIEETEHPVSAKEISSGFRLVAVAVLSAIVGAVATAGTLYEMGWLKSVQRPLTAAQPAAVPAPAAVEIGAATYSSPSRVYYKPVRPDFLLYTNESLLVSSANSGKIVRLNEAGQVIGAVQQPPDSLTDESSSRYYASDRFGNIYTTNAASGKLAREDVATGATRMIASGLTEPGAIAVSETGDVYFIENGQLEVIHPILASGKQ